VVVRFEALVLQVLLDATAGGMMCGVFGGGGARAACATLIVRLLSGVVLVC
jgi:hypothetical protein